MCAQTGTLNCEFWTLLFCRRLCRTVLQGYRCSLALCYWLVFSGRLGVLKNRFIAPEDSKVGEHTFVALVLTYNVLKEEKRRLWEWLQKIVISSSEPEDRSLESSSTPGKLGFLSQCTPRSGHVWMYPPEFHGSACEVCVCVGCGCRCLGCDRHSHLLNLQNVLEINA